MNTFRTIREQLGLTQASLAESLGVTQGNVAHYERGQTIPPEVARRLIIRANELGLPITFDDVYASYLPEKIRLKQKPKVSKRTPSDSTAS